MTKHTKKKERRVHLNGIFLVIKNVKENEMLGRGMYGSI